MTHSACQIGITIYVNVIAVGLHVSVCCPIGGEALLFVYVGGADLFELGFAALL